MADQNSTLNKKSIEEMRRERLNLPASKLPLVEEHHPAEDFRGSFHWRVFRIMAEFVDGWQFLADFGKKSVTFFGSARFPEGTKWYEEARKLGGILAKEGYNIITGGGPGIMEAGNQGAHEVHEQMGENVAGIGDSIGLNIKLPFEQRINAYVDKAVAFHYFFVRKVMLSYYAQAYVYFPGGFGTLDEAFELITLIQTKKIPSTIPVIFMGKDFWQPCLDWIRLTLLAKYQAIDAEDMNIIRLVDNAEEAAAIVRAAPLRVSIEQRVNP